MDSNFNLLDCIQFSENDIPCNFDDFSEDFFRFSSLSKPDPPRDFLGIESSRECSDDFFSKDFCRFDLTPAQSGKSNEILETKEMILENARQLLKPSKKISKGAKNTGKKNNRNKAEKSDNLIVRQNAKRLSGFFKKWRDLRRKDLSLGERMKLWFSSYNLKLNKTYIYRDFFDSVRIHFRIALREKGFKFHRMKQNDWQDLFINLTEYLKSEIEKSKDVILQRKKCQVYPVFIDGLNLFTIGDLSTHLDEKVDCDSP